MRVPAYLWSKTVRELDDNRCVFCHTTEKLEAHHIQPRRKDPDLETELENGITLCRRCHDTAHCGNYAVDMPLTWSYGYDTRRYSTRPAAMVEFIEAYQANMEILYCEMLKKEAREFREACKAAGTTPNAIFRQAMREFMEQKKTD